MDCPPRITMHNQPTIDQPTIVAVIADTHANHLAELPPELRSALSRADLIVHLGDYTSKELLDDLRKLGNFYGIAGNHDDRFLHQELKDMAVLEVGGKRLGLIHGLIWPLGSHKRMKAWFKKHKIDAILYGHTHLAGSRFVDDMFVFNPGSVTGQFPAYYGSFGLLTVDGTVSGEIIHLDCPGTGKWWGMHWVRAMLIQRAMRWFETWPYVDLRYYMAGLGPTLKRPVSSLRGKFFSKKRAPGPLQFSGSKRETGDTGANTGGDRQ